MKKPKSVAIFDLDHTVCKTDSYLRFLGIALWHRPTRLITVPWLALAVLISKIGLKRDSWLKEQFLSCIAGGLNVQEVKIISDKLVNHLMQEDLRKGAVEAIRFHREAGDYLILATASFDFYVEQLGQSLGFDRIVCTEAEWRETGKLSGKICGTNCKGHEKLRKVQNALSEVSYCKTKVYSDHHADLPLFNWADHAYFVRPTKQLLRSSPKFSFTICEW